jgi:hypothetical protein
MILNEQSLDECGARKALYMHDWVTYIFDMPA